MLTSRVSVVDQPGALAIGLLPYGSCMAQLVRSLEVADPASGKYPEGPLRRDALSALHAAQCAYPPALGAVVRASSPSSSAADFASALAREDRGCAGAFASMARLYTSGSPQASDLLGQLSSHPGAPEAALAAASSDSRVTVSRSTAGASAGIFPHGLALQQLTCAAAGASAAPTRGAWRRRSGRVRAAARCPDLPIAVAARYLSSRPLRCRDGP